MTSSEVEIGDIGMLSYRLPVARFPSQNSSHPQAPRRSYSCLNNPQEHENLPIKWELTSRTQVLADDPLGLLNPITSNATTCLPTERTTSLLTKPFANLNPTPTEIKGTTKEDEISALRNIPTSINQLRARFTQSGISALYSPKKFDTIKNYALDRLSDLKTSVKSTAIPLTQSKSLYTVKNSIQSKDHQLLKDNSNSKLRGSHSSLVSQQSSNSSILNANYFNGLDINNVNEDIKALRLHPSSVAIPIVNESNEKGNFPSRIIEMSSCNRCAKCDHFLYDEEIMNGWSPDESELHTVCVHCGEKTIPNLTIYIRVDFRFSLKFKQKIFFPFRFRTLEHRPIRI